MKVIVVLAAVEGEVSRVAHELGNGLDPFGKMNAGVLGNDLAIGPTTGTVLVRAGGGLHHTRDHGGAASRANRSGNEGPFEKHTILRELIDDRSEALVDRVIIAAHVGREIFRENPKNIGSISGGERKKGGEEDEQGTDVTHVGTMTKWK